VPRQQVGELVTGELTSPIGVEDIRFAMPGQRFVDRLDAKVRVQRDRNPPRQRPARKSVQRHHEVDESPHHRM
jgi:hypothetical protein